MLILPVMGVTKEEEKGMGGGGWSKTSVKVPV